MALLPTLSLSKLRLGTRRLYAVLFLVLLLTWLHYSYRSPNLPRPVTGYGALTSTSRGVPLVGGIPLITLVVVFKGKDMLPFTPYFLDSIRRQKAVELVIVQRGGECSDLKKWTKVARNIRHICLSEKDFWAAHVDYFCGKWGGCNSKQRELMHRDMLRLGEMKSSQSYFPILRGNVFASYVSPKSAFWGFCDMDIALGDLSRTFPFDIALDDYDIITTSQPNPSGGDRVVFMRGHLTLVRNSPETEMKIMRWDHFRNFDEWEYFGYPNPSIEECEYSHFVVAESDLNILIVDGLALSGAAVLSSSQAGVLTLPDSLRPSSSSSLPDPSIPSPILRALLQPLPRDTHRSFSSDGIETSITVYQGDKTPLPPGLEVWFEEEFASWYDGTPAPKTVGRWRRYLMKRNGRWTERLEPVRDWARGAALEGAQEWVYVHFQEEKRRAHFRELEGIPADIFVSYSYDGVAGFTRDGKRAFWNPRRAENCASDGCVEIGATPIAFRPEFLEYLADQGDMVMSYIESKAQRLGLSLETGAAVPRGARPARYGIMQKLQKAGRAGMGG